MSDESKQRITWGVSLSGVVAAIFLLWGVIAWATDRASEDSVTAVSARVSTVEGDVSVLKSELNGIAEDVRYIRKRVDDRRD